MLLYNVNKFDIQHSVCSTMYFKSHILRSKGHWRDKQRAQLTLQVSANLVRAAPILGFLLLHGNSIVYL